MLQVSPISKASESGQLSDLGEVLDEVNQHFDQTVKVDRNEDPLQQFTQLPHGVARGERPHGRKKTSGLVEVWKQKSPQEAGCKFRAINHPKNS